MYKYYIPEYYKVKLVYIYTVLYSFCNNYSCIRNFNFFTIAAGSFTIYVINTIRDWTASLFLVYL